MTFGTQVEARAEAIRQHGGQIDLFEEIAVFGKNPNLRGPNGEPSFILRTADQAGNIIDIQHHSNGHLFFDKGLHELPHYHGPGGLGHLSYGE